LHDYIILHLEHLEYLSQKLKEISNNETLDPSFVSLMMEAKIYYPGFTEKLQNSGNIIFNKWVNVISRAKSTGEIRNDIETDILAENFIATGYSIFRYLLTNRSFEYSFSMIKLQYNQLYRLIKI
jgi:TetR/AcrR family transcriptional regulator, transcriptional repressor for nem operon